MSLSTDVRDAFSKPEGLKAFGENHPVLLTLGATAAFLAAFIFVSRYLFLMF